ncbi:hypothetical protein H2200_009341 [Cladophialophora chaetospira]|uniref:Uncharacterized protein n=1 Tax=Cladophialophora chaetospira TaxID=386627 RepID=A0AA38X496_9EURO|nr:hypothetical protein H2200_009341 [Cladophialophora chaetospira]
MATAQAQTTGYREKLFGKHILILGGTSGIGLAVAEAAREFGATIVVSSSNPRKIDAAIRKLEEIQSGADTTTDDNGRVQGFPCNLDDLDRLEGNLKLLFEKATDGGRDKLDHVVYTAGNKVGSIPLADTNTKMITEHGILRFYVPIMIGKLSQNYMHNSPQSSMTFTSGVNNVKPVPGRVLMAGWGAGVEGITRALAVDLRPIRVNCICPGPTRTELFDDFPDEVLQPLLKKYMASTMTGTIGYPEDIAETYLYCMRDSFVDGTVIHSSGGYLLA